MIRRLLLLLFPPKCILCRSLLGKEQTDLCPDCRANAPTVEQTKIKFNFLAHWTGIWYYKENVRNSILRYKFGYRRHYGAAYGRLMAMHLQSKGWDDADILTWIPISPSRKFRRGYDQTQVFAKTAARELGRELTPTLKKIRNTKPQSTMGSATRRRANILGAYRVIDPTLVKDKRIVLMDDILTTGATASECAKTLLIAGAKEVNLATLAVANHDNPR